MIRAILLAVTLLGFAGSLTLAADQDKAAKQNQMVKGTIKSVDAVKGILIVDQKLKDQTTVRQLDITDKTEFVIAGKPIQGKLGLQDPAVKEGAQVTIKCDKDVNVLQVKVDAKK